MSAEEIELKMEATTSLGSPKKPPGNRNAPGGPPSNQHAKKHGVRGLQIARRVGKIIHGVNVQIGLFLKQRQMKGQAKKAFTIIDAIQDKDVFGSLPAFQSLNTWKAWTVWLKCIFAIPIQPMSWRSTGNARAGVTH
jgi:hypothetical protein